MPESCPEKQKACRQEMEARIERQTPWRAFVLTNAFVASLAVGAYGYALYLDSIGSQRATTSESRSADVQRSVDKANVRGEGMELTLTDVRQILRGIQTDLIRVEKAVIRMEVRADRIDAAKP